MRSTGRSRRCGWASPPQAIRSLGRFYDSLMTPRNGNDICVPIVVDVHGSGSIGMLNSGETMAVLMASVNQPHCVTSSGSLRTKSSRAVALLYCGSVVLLASPFTLKPLPCFPLFHYSNIPVFQLPSLLA